MEASHLLRRQDRGLRPWRQPGLLRVVSCRPCCCHLLGRQQWTEGPWPTRCCSRLLLAALLRKHTLALQHAQHSQHRGNGVRIRLHSRLSSSGGGSDGAGTVGTYYGLPGQSRSDLRPVLHGPGPAPTTKCKRGVPLQLPVDLDGLEVFSKGLTRKPGAGKGQGKGQIAQRSAYRRMASTLARAVCGNSLGGLDDSRLVPKNRELGALQRLWRGLPRTRELMYGAATNASARSGSSSGIDQLGRR